MSKNASAADSKPVSAAEAKTLFAGLDSHSSLVLAVSGGPDSTALLYLLSRWRSALKAGPKLVACTIDHGLRPESAKEAKAVGRLARKLGVAHRIVQWRGKKPVTGIQQAAREARYRLLADAARTVKASHILTAHTLDDQAETVLLRLTRGSGLTGLGGMTAESRLPLAGMQPRDRILLRPFLSFPKARLIATLRKAKIAFAEDPSNADPKFTRVRLRGLASVLEKEGLSAQRLSLLARRVRRADRALDAMVEVAAARIIRPAGTGKPGFDFDMDSLVRLPEEVVLRLLGRAIGVVGDEGPVELGKLEALLAALFGPSGRGAASRRTLAGAIVTRRGDVLTVERAPPRRR